MSSGDWEAVIGLEIHAQLLTKSKIFSPDSASFGGGDNQHVHPVSLGMPGTLPVLNEKAVELSVLIGLALNCKINKQSVFSRKNYFYPDLPKGYQISQFDVPLCENGHVDFFVNGESMRVEITRAHMEEDAGKSTHHGDGTLLNYNRAGVPLLEIVSAPVIRSPAVAAEYVRAIRRTLRYLEACDGNLEEGSLRCDCNVSIRQKGDHQLGTRVEIKNINSFRFIEKAIEYEIQRQIDLVETGQRVVQETRLFDSVKNRTYSMRSKEDAHDYRYFPDPDLLPLEISSSWIEKLQRSLPELPFQRIRRFQNDFGLSHIDASHLADEIDLGDYFEEAVKVCSNPKSTCNWIMVELLRELNLGKIEIKKSPVSPQNLGLLIQFIDQGSISGKIGKLVFAEMWSSGRRPDQVIEEKGFVQVSDNSTLEKIIDEILAKNSGQVEQYRSGKEKVFGFFVGQVMRETKGQANPDLVNSLLLKKLRPPL
jgi:aspartyl-tRNA(Asn)/glutamyl-tRNA(Gln) amidotransferase subunit B